MGQDGVHEDRLRQPTFDRPLADPSDAVHHDVGHHVLQQIVQCLSIGGLEVSLQAVACQHHWRTPARPHNFISEARQIESQPVPQRALHPEDQNCAARSHHAVALSGQSTEPSSSMCPQSTRVDAFML